MLLKYVPTNVMPLFQGKPGQKINFTLFSFSSLQNYHIVQHSAVCPYYAILKVS